MTYNNKVIIHGGTRSDSLELERDLATRLSDIAHNCLEFVPLSEFEADRNGPPYGLVWYQNGQVNDLFEQLQFTDIKRVVLYDPRMTPQPSEHAHVRVQYPGPGVEDQILRALNWDLRRAKDI